MAGATGANADKEKRAWMRDDTGKRSAGGHMGYSENTSCRSVHAWDKYMCVYNPGVFLSEIRGGVERTDELGSLWRQERRYCSQEIKKGYSRHFFSTI